jgi:hypothetical protein
VHLIQEIGSYAGLAAIPGLAVLSALYFSQARDVRRLRDWAGRAPERAAEQAQGGRVGPPVAQPAARPAPQPVAQPGAQPAAAAAAGAAPATASGAADGGGTATAAPPRTHPATAAGATAAGAAAGAGGPGGPRRIAPRVPGTGQTSILGQGAPPEPDPWYRRLAARLPAARYLAVLVVGIAVVGGGIAYGITQLGNDKSGSGEQQASKTSKDKKSSKPKAVVPGDVTVSVLNGTTATGLAHSYGTKLEHFGFNVGNLVTARQGQVAESVVLFAPGSNREARAVADKLHINNIEPADSDSRSQGGSAGVIVVVGADKAPAEASAPPASTSATPAPVSPAPTTTTP